MNNLQIYLAGKMSGLTTKEMRSWRDYFSILLKEIAENMGVNVKVINPCDYYTFDFPKHQSELEVMNFDLSRVKESNLVVVNMDGLNTSIGTIIECYEAYKQGIPVLAFGSDEEYEKLHPWVQCCITRHDKNYRKCINYIGDFYMS